MYYVRDEYIEMRKYNYVLSYILYNVQYMYIVNSIKK